MGLHNSESEQMEDHFPPHNCRHWMTTHLRRAGMRQEIIQELRGDSIRERFGIDPKNIAAASRLIREAVEAGFILPYDAEAAPKLMRYVPFWANPTKDAMIA